MSHPGSRLDLGFGLWQTFSPRDVDETWARARKWRETVSSTGAPIEGILPREPKARIPVGGTRLERTTKSCCRARHQERRESCEYKQKQARNRRKSTQHRATWCAKRSLRLSFSESSSNSAAVKIKNQLNRSEGTKVMDV